VINNTCIAQNSCCDSPTCWTE